MKRVGIRQIRHRTDYVGRCGHRLVPVKGKWQDVGAGAMGRECPVCPEGEPAKVECDWAAMFHVLEALSQGYRYCPRCGATLEEMNKVGLCVHCGNLYTIAVLGVKGLTCPCGKCPKAALRKACRCTHAADPAASDPSPSESEAPRRPA